MYVRPPDKHSELLYHRVCAEVKHIFVKMSSFFGAFGLFFYLRFSAKGDAATGTCVIDCRGGPCGRPAAVTDVLRPRRGEYVKHTPYRRATARVAPTVCNVRLCSVGAALW